MKFSTYLMLFLVVTLFGCVSAKSVEEKASVKNEQGAISIVSVERQDSYRDGNRILSAKDPLKASLVLVHASFVNLGKEKVVIPPYAAQLQLASESKGVGPEIIDYTNPGEAFLLSLTGRSAFADINLDPGQAARRIFVFVFPKNQEPTLFQLHKSNGDKKLEPWISSPIQK